MTAPSALGNGTYRRLLIAQVVSLVGTGLATVALGLLAYDVAGGGTGAGRVLGTVFAIKMVAYVVVAPVAQALVARLPRRRVMVVADVLRAVVAVGLPLVAEVWQVYVLVFVLQAASAVHTPTFQAALPDVLTDVRQYTQALSITRIAEDLEMVLSPVLAAALLVLVPYDALFLGTGAGFAASALLIAAIAVPRGTGEATSPFDELPFGARVRHGTRLMWRTPALRPVLALNLAVAAGGAFVLVQTVVIARTTFGQDDDVAALMLAVVGAGSMGAALGLPALLRGAPERPVMLGGAAVLTVATALVPLALLADGPLPGLVAVGVLWIAVGAGWACAEVPVGRLVVREVAEHERPAVFAAQFSLSHLCWLFTYPTAGWLGAVGLGRTALLLAAVAAAATTAAARLWPAASVPTS